jgi:hypothetical protein
MSNFFEKVFGLGSTNLQDKIDKVDTDRQLVDELRLSMSDDEILKLTQTWKRISTALSKEIEDTGKENITYYI